MMDCRDYLDFQNQGNPEILPSWSGFFLRLVGMRHLLAWYPPLRWVEATHWVAPTCVRMKMDLELQTSSDPGALSIGMNFTPDYLMGFRHHHSNAADSPRCNR